MRIIPVLDIKHGLVVRARMGNRLEYAPIESPLSRTAQPLDVAEGLLAVHPFETLYVADLDGIEGRERNDETIVALRRRWPGLEVWVDAGLVETDEVARWTRSVGARPVIGSETGIPARSIPQLRGFDPVLSLDYRGREPIGDIQLFELAEFWPRDVVVMSLSKVGSGSGPDLERLKSTRDLAGPSRAVHAAGGVRDAADLRALKRLGISGALVATALHDGRLDSAAIADLERR